MRRILTCAVTATTESLRRRTDATDEARTAADGAAAAMATAADSADRRGHSWRVWRRPRTLAAAAFGALLLSWGTASALSGPEPVPATYSGDFVLTYGGQDTRVLNVSGCDYGRGSLGATIVKPCQLEVPASAGPLLKQKIVAALTGATTPASNAFTLTHYASNQQATAYTPDYAVTGDFTISKVTLPVLDQLANSTDNEYLGIELTPAGHNDITQLPSNATPSVLPAAAPFQVGVETDCGQLPPLVKPPAIQIPDFATTTPRSLTVSVNTTPGQLAVNVGSVRLSQGDTAEITTARSWVVTPQLRTLTINMAAYNCSTGARSNQFKMSFPVDAPTMDPFARTDGYFTLGLAAHLRSGSFPTVSWQ